MGRWKRLAFVAGLALALGVPGVVAAGPGVDLSGTWTLNKDLSDKPPSAEDQGGREGGGGGGHRPGPGGGGGGAGGMMGSPAGMMPGGGHRPDPEEMRRIRGQVTEAAQPDEKLVVVQSPEGVSITTGDGRFIKLLPDGKAHESLTGDGVLKTKTKWDGDKLVSEGKIEDGITVTRTYTLDQAEMQKRLVLLVRIAAPGGRAPHEIKRVYEVAQ